MGRYLTFGRYEELGGLLAEDAFNRVIDLASASIDKATFGRISQDDISDRALCCARDLCDLYGARKATGRELSSKSQSAGGVSESESYTVKTDDEFSALVDTVIVEYLSTETATTGTPLLYKGAMR